MMQTDLRPYWNVDGYLSHKDTSSTNETQRIITLLTKENQRIPPSESWI
jgi:hypothetical protein